MTPTKTDLLKATLGKLYRDNDEASARSLPEYLDRVVIDCVPTPARFGTVAEWWQKDRNAALTPMFQYIGGLQTTYTGPMNAWVGLAKGNDKTSTIARYLNWLGAYAKRPLRVICAAKDREQAEVCRDVMEKESRLNKWVADRLEFKRSMVEGKKNGTKIEFLTSDAGGAHGRTPDFILMDELSNWESDDLFQSLFSATVKRAGFCGLVILTNAGLLGSWQHSIRCLAEQENGKTWLFMEQQPGERYASWMTPTAIEQASKFLSPTEARRLYRNEWIDPAEAGLKLFSPTDVDRCCGPVLPPPPGSTVVCGVDYGGTCDRTALSVLWYDTHTLTAHVVSQTVWQGSPENEVKIRDVESWMRLQLSLYPGAMFVIDTLGQMVGTAQEFEDAGHKVVRFAYRGGKQNALMLQTLRSFLSNQRLRFTLDCGIMGGSTLATELKEVVGKSLSYGERIDHKSGRHDDRCVSVGMALLAAIENTVPGPVPQKGVPDTSNPFHNQMPRSHSSLDRGHASRRGLFGLQSPHA